jgi:hypothetical protein
MKAEKVIRRASGANLFLRILQKGFFQQPQAISHRSQRMGDYDDISPDGLKRTAFGGCLITRFA